MRVFTGHDIPNWIVLLLTLILALLVEAYSNLIDLYERGRLREDLCDKELDDWHKKYLRREACHADDLNEKSQEIKALQEEKAGWRLADKAAIEAQARIITDLRESCAAKDRRTIAELTRERDAAAGMAEAAKRASDDLTRIIAEHERERSCICHRIPSKDWHLERCPARTPAPQEKPERDGTR